MGHPSSLFSAIHASGRRKWQARAVDGGLLPFQRQFVASVTRQEHPPEIAALSVPRGNGKSRGYAAVWWRGR